MEVIRINKVITKDHLASASSDKLSTINEDSESTPIDVSLLFFLENLIFRLNNFF